MMEDLRYPIGRFVADTFTDAVRRRCVDALAALPQNLEAAVDGWSEVMLDTPYRPEGWTVRQLVHHVADSHLNAYIRFRLALTEEKPLVKTYDQEKWAALADARTAPVDLSLRLIRALHQRWVLLLGSLAAADFERRLNHPELGEISLGFLLQLYAWHGSHHVAHIAGLEKRLGW
jgi:hypothetical protein